MPPLRRQHHLRSALEAFLRQRDLEAAYRALTLGGWMAHYFQSRGPRQEAALKTHVREPFPFLPLALMFSCLPHLSRALRPVRQTLGAAPQDPLTSYPLGPSKARLRLLGQVRWGAL